ncbi:MAG: CvpA family protein [Anaerolineae bacterium]|nr:CvpA family protein [Anaerolineae bacterium]
MIELIALLFVMTVLWGVFGFFRGLNRELIATAGIILAMFALFQFDSLIRTTLLGGVSTDQVFLIQTLIFVIIVFFAYRTRTFFGRDVGRDGRNTSQNSVLGALVGALNGYLIWGTIWYFMDINEYPLSPYIIAPAPGSVSDQARNALPLVFLGGGPTGNGDLLAVLVIVMFVIVLALI